jgi:hypothetical protein
MGKTKVIATCKNGFETPIVSYLGQRVFVECQAPANTVAILGSAPIGAAPVFLLNPSDEVPPEMATNKFGLVQVEDGRAFLAVAQPGDADCYDLVDLRGVTTITCVKIKSITPIISAQFAA